MPIWKAALLGLVQGIGEFLPISSSGHLVLLSWFMKSDYQGLAFDVALHVGTLLALVIFFWRDWIRIIMEGLTKGLRTTDGKIFWFIIAGSIPAAAFAFTADDLIETTFREPVVIGVMLIVMGIVLYLADAYGRKRKDMERITFWDSMAVGLMQAMALIPGTSRSGATMTGALFAGLTRESAARFSFLLSAPAILGAAVLELPALVKGGIDAPVIVGTIVSFVSGLFAIGFLLRFLRTNGFLPFVVYRIILGVAVIAMSLAK